jgi:hypothetical protein
MSATRLALNLTAPGAGDAMASCLFSLLNKHDGHMDATSLSRPAREAWNAIRTLLRPPPVVRGEDGESVYEAVGRVWGKSRVSVYSAINELESQRFVRREGRTNAMRLVVLVQKPEQTSTQEQDAIGRRVGPSEWRSLRARLGGTQRALAQVQVQRDAARARLRELERGHRASAWRHAADPELVALRRDLLHAADCGDPDCARCAEALFELESGTPRYADVDEMIAALDRGEVVERAATALVESLRMGVGSQSRRVLAVEVIRAARAHDLDQAHAMLARLEACA